MNTPEIPKEMAAVMFAHGHLFRQHVSFKDQVGALLSTLFEFCSAWVLFHQHMSSE